MSDDIENSLFLLDDDEAPKASKFVKALELVEYELAPGNIFWNKKFGNKVKIYKAGAVVDSVKMERFSERGIELEVEWFATPKNIHLLKEKLTFLKEAKDIKEKVSARDSIIKVLNEYYWQDDENVSVLDLLIPFYNTFFMISDSDHQNKIMELGEDYFYQAAYSGTLNVILCLLLGYQDYHFLSDIYQVAFLYEVGVSSQVSSASYVDALFDKNKVSTLEGINKDSYEKHSTASFELAQKEYKSYFFNETIMRLIKIHHEDLEGTGFPEKLNEDILSDYEKVIIFTAHKGLPEDSLNSKKSASGLLREVVFSDGLSETVKVVISKIFESAIKEKKNKKLDGILVEAV